MKSKAAGELKKIVPYLRSYTLALHIEGEIQG